MVEYSVKIDLNRDGQFNHPLSDITHRVRDSVSFTTGFQNPNDLPHNATSLVSPSNMMTLTLDNRDGAFFYDEAGSGDGSTYADFYGLMSKSLMIRFSMTSGGVTHSYTFYTVGLRLTVGQFNEQIAVLTCRDAIHRLQTVKYEPSVKRDKLSSDAIIDFFNESDIALPYASDFFILNVSELDGDRLLYDADTETAKITDIETGFSILEYVGDVLRKSADDTVLLQNGLGFVYDVCMGEAFGRLFFNPRDNKYHWFNRHHDANENPKLTVTEHDLIQLQTRQSDVANDIRVFYTPREIGETDTVLFEAQGLPLIVAPQTSATVGVQFKDPNNKSDYVVALSTRRPVKDVDIVATLESGGDVSGSILSGTSLNSTGGELRFYNGFSESVNITKIQVRGTPIYQYDRQYARAVDALSIYNHNPTQLPDLQINYIFDENFAQSVADFLLRRYSTKRRVADTATVMLREENFIDVMSVDIGDCITVSLSNSNHVNDYIVIGEQHNINISGGTHQLTWVLHAKTETPFFILDRDTLDDETVIIGY